MHNWHMLNHNNLIVNMTTATTNQLRLFFALWPDEVTRSALTRLQFSLQGNKIRYRNFQITLAFLGDQDASLLPMLQSILANLDGQEMYLQIDQLGYFARQRIAFASMKRGSEELNRLQAKLTAELTAHDLKFESRALFRPHLTLAREAENPVSFKFDPIIWHAKQIALIKSVMHEDGVHYEVLASHWLQRPAP
jgi:RNA 2',3'-cyclic 3'-phosphodiesterase